MEANKPEEEVNDQTMYTEVDFSWPEEIIRRTKNLIDGYKIRKRWIKIQNIKKSNLKKTSTKSK